MSDPWMKFYPSDWRADPALRMCSLAARGLWAEMMCIMHEAEPYGHLLVNGKALNEKQLASLSGGDLRETVNALAELESCGVFSKSETGVIYSRRMKRDREKAERDKANGKGGGNPWLKAGVNPPGKPSEAQGDKAHIPEAREPESESKDDAPSGAPKFAFESGRIRLNAQNLAQWKAAFLNLDLEAELLGLSDWAEKQGSNWFVAVSGALAKRNREIGLRQKRQGGPTAPMFNRPYTDFIT